MLHVQSTATLSDLFFFFLAELLQLNPACVCTAARPCLPRTHPHGASPFSPGLFPNLEVLLLVVIEPSPVLPLASCRLSRSKDKLHLHHL